MKVKRVVILCWAVLVFCGFSACSNEKSKLVGRWAPIDSDRWRFEFTANGLSVNGGDSGIAYTIEKGAIKVTFMGNVNIFVDSFEFVDNDTLILTGGSNPFPGTYKRVE